MPNLTAISTALQNIKNKVPALTQQVNQVAPQTPQAPASPTVAPQPPQTQPVAQTPTPTAQPDQNDFIKALQGISGSTSTDPMAQLASIYAKAYTPTQTETDLTSKVQKTTSMLDSLEHDLTVRMSGAGPMSSSFMNRELAVEQAPLAKELQQESQALGTAQGQRTSLAGAIPGLKSLAEYQTPQQQLATKLAEEQAEKLAGLGSYADLNKPSVLPQGSDLVSSSGQLLAQGQPHTTQPKTVGSASTGFYTVNPDGTKGQMIVPPAPKTTNSGTDESSVASALYNVGIPAQVATTGGTLNKFYLDKLVNAGVPADLATALFNEILGGTSLEDIRQQLRSQGVDPALLDTYMMTLQGVKSGSTKSSTKRTL